MIDLDEKGTEVLLHRAISKNLTLNTKLSNNDKNLQNMGAMCCGGDDAESKGGNGSSNNKKKSKSKGTTGNRLGGGDDGSSDGMSARERAAMAAEKRSEDAMGGNTELKNKRTRDNLVGRIEALYAKAGKDPPFGLRAASKQALKKHLETAKNM